MRSLSLLLLPLIAALPNPSPAKHSDGNANANAIPELDSAQWAEVQSGFTSTVRTGLHSLKGLGEWSWSVAHDLVQEHEHDFEQAYDAVMDGDDTQKTIWQRLKDDPHSFSRLTGLIEFVGGKPKEILDDKDLQITFFAPNNDALKPPEHHHSGDHDHDHDAALAALAADPSLASLVAHHSAYFATNEDKGGDGDGDDDDKKKRRKEIFKHIAAKVLAYHGLPKAYTAAQLAQNSTLETGLKAEDGSYAGLHRRVRVEKTLIPPSLKLNFYARVVAADRKAVNGYFHSINHPLIPPGSIFESLYIFPDFFSTLTSAIQGSHGRDYLDWGYDREESKPGKPVFSGTPVASFFAPTNTAFHLLPPRLKFFLFSPFGERALKKVLAYHYVPHSILLSEFQYHEKHDHKHEHAQMSMWDDNDPTFHKELEVPTGLPNATLKVEIDKTKPLPIDGAVRTTIKVNGQQVETIDIPARNGAFHVLAKLLIPPHHHHHDGDHKETQAGVVERSWDNWEEWLPAWAAEE